MMKPRSIMIVVGLLCLALLGAGGITMAAPMPTTPGLAALQATPVAQGKGTVNVAVANVRGRPSTASPILGKLRKGAPVEITNRRSGWLEIIFPSGPGQRAWISAPLVTEDGAKGAAAATNSKGKSAASAAVPPPVPKDYKQPTFLWSWNGEKTVQGQDWYFDILLFQGGQSLPYETIPVEPDQANYKNGVWSYSKAPRLQCDSTWMMAISTREDNRWAGWASPLSKGLPIGKACENECNDPCPGCGDGGCAD